MKFKKVLALILSSAMCLSMLAACGGDDTANTPNTDPAPTQSQTTEQTPAPSETTPAAPAGEFVWNGEMEVWSILPTTGAEGLVWINDAMGAVMQAEGFTYVKKDAQGDPTAQVAFVEDAIAAGNVGCLMIAAMSVDMLQDVVEQAIEAGIAIAMLGAEPTNYQIAGCVYTAYEITGMYAVQAAEDWAAKRVAEGGNVPTNADGKFEVACDVYTDIQDGVYRSNAIVGTVDASETLVRVSTTSSYGNSAYSDAYNNAQDVLGANPNCRIFIAYEPEEAMGAADAIKDFAEMNGLDLADFCVIPCYAEDTTFTERYNAAYADHSADAIKGYSTYGDAPLPHGDAVLAMVGEASFDAVTEFANNLMPGAPVIIPPVFTGWHLAEILLGVCGFEGHTWEYGATYYDTISVVNVYDYSNTWSMGDANPALDYKTVNYIG